MTNKEFQEWLSAEFAKYPLLNRSNPKSENELIYVLRMSGKDFTLNDIVEPDEFCTDTYGAFSFTPSIQETFIPTRVLARKVLSVEYFEEDEESELPLVIIHTKEAV